MCTYIRPSRLYIGKSAYIRCFLFLFEKNGYMHTFESVYPFFSSVGMVRLFFIIVVSVTTTTTPRRRIYKR